MKLTLLQLLDLAIHEKIERFGAAMQYAVKHASSQDEMSEVRRELWQLGFVTDDMNVRELKRALLQRSAALRNDQSAYK